LVLELLEQQILVVVAAQVVLLRLAVQVVQA